MVLVLKVKANYPKDMKILEDKIAEAMSKILVNALSNYEIEQLLGVFQNDSKDIRW